MKKLIVALTALFSLSTFANTYLCRIAVVKDGSYVAEHTFTHSKGTAAGSIARVKVFQKKNLLGKVIKTEEIVLSGVMDSGGADREASFRGQLSFVETKNGSRIETVEIPLKIMDEVKGSFELNHIYAPYTIEGECNAVSFSVSSDLNTCNE